LFLLILWVAVIAAFMQAFPSMHSKGVLLVHTTFWMTAAACTLIVLVLPSVPHLESKPELPPDEPSWLPGWKHGMIWLCMPPSILLLAWLSVMSHSGPLPHSNLRFGEEVGKKAQ
jgi:hypothetical protein